MRSIPDRELGDSDSAVLRDVAAGATVEVTDHGEVVAVLSPPRAAPGSAVRVARATRVGGFAALPRARFEVATSTLLDDLRDER